MLDQNRTKNIEKKIQAFFEIKIKTKGKMIRFDSIRILMIMLDRFE